MAIVRWEPFGAFDELFNRAFPAYLGRGATAAADQAVEWTPSVDVSETDAEYVVRAELPAVKKDDVHVTLDGNLLTIRGERRYEKEDKAEKVHRKESFHGLFSRSLVLPDNADGEQVRAESKDGILTVRIAKIQPTKPTPRRITVQ
ncbi:MAG: Hsp20/alpha crystallin family protein [Steroidobacteraceae bacterium]